MEKIIQNKLAVKIICAAMSIILWFYVSYQENPSMTKTVENIPVTITGEQALNENGFSVYSVSTNSIDVIADAKRLTLARLSGKNTYATINVSSFKKAGRFTVPATVSTTLTSDATFSVKGKSIVVTIEPINSKSFDIKADISSTNDGSVKIASHKLSTKTVQVTAPESILNAIESIKTENITPTKDTPTQSVKLVAYGKNGKPLEGVECSPSEVELSFSFYNSKTVPVVLKVSSGKTYSLPESAKVKIFGTKSLLEEITEIETKEVSIEQFDVNSAIRPTLNLPKNVFLEDMHPGYIEIVLQDEFYN